MVLLALADCVTVPQLLAAAAVVLTLVVVGNFVWRLFWNASLPAHLPWAGAASGNALSKARANLTSVFHMKSLLEEGYDKVGPTRVSKASHLWHSVAAAANEVSR